MLSSFRTRQAALIGLIVLGSSLALAWWLGAQLAQERVAAQGRALHEMARSIGVVLGAGLDDRLTQIEALARADLVPYARRLQAVDNQTLDRVAATRSHYSWIGVMDAQGRVSAATRGMLVGQSVAARPWFQQGLKGAHVGDVHAAKLLAAMLPASVDGGPLRFLDFAAPLQDDDGKVIGVLGAHVNWDWVRALIGSLGQPGDAAAGLEVYLLDRQGQVILRPVGQAATGVTPALPAAAAALVADADGVAHLAARAPLTAQLEPNRLGWTVLVRQSAGAALAPARDAERRVWLAGLLVAAVAMAAAWWLAGSFARPLIRISVAARAIEAGRLDTPLPHSGGLQELRVLGEALSGMTRSLLNRERALREANEQLESRVVQRTAELQAANAELQALARTDALTGLASRRAAEERLAIEWRRHARHQQILSLLVIDIDHFKAINDRHGHAAGDAVLAAVAKALQQACRVSDLVARTGGEEFLVLLPQTDAEGALCSAEKLRLAIEGLNPAPVGRVTVSIGIATSRDSLAAAAGDGRHDATAVLAEADAALYAAKHAGRNRVVRAGAAAVVLAGRADAAATNSHRATESVA